MYKEDLALNNPQLLICYKSKPNQTKIIVLHSQREKLSHVCI